MEGLYGGLLAEGASSCAGVSGDTSPLIPLFCHNALRHLYPSLILPEQNSLSLGPHMVMNTRFYAIALYGEFKLAKPDLIHSFLAP